MLYVASTSLPPTPLADVWRIGIPPSTLSPASVPSSPSSPTPRPPFFSVGCCVSEALRYSIGRIRIDEFVLYFLSPLVSPPPINDGIALPPRLSRSSRIPSIVPSVAAACFWLVVALFLNVFHFIFIFCRSNSLAITTGRHPPTRSLPPHALPL